MLTLPLAVEVEVPADSSVTQLRVAGGGGHYLAVVRDCDGDVIGQSEDSFYDAAASIDHKFGGTPISLGVSGGFLHDGRFDDGENYYYVGPNMGLSWGRFGMAIGATYFSHELLDPDDVSPPLPDNASLEDVWLPAVALRFGRPSGPYLTASVLSAFPMYSGGGYAEIGIGGKVTNGPAIWGGVNLVGMTATGLQARFQWALSDRVLLDTGGSVGSHEGETQYGGSIGVTYRVVH